MEKKGKTKLGKEVERNSEHRKKLLERMCAEVERNKREERDTVFIVTVRIMKA